MLRYTANAKYYDFAELAYQRALKLDPRSIDAMSGMAWVTGGRHLFDQSISWANRALTIDPSHASSHGFVGDAALELGDYVKAFSEYHKMMDLRPDLSSWSRGSYLLWLTGNRTKAMRLIEKAIKAESVETNDRAWCRAKLALLLFDDGAYAPAANALKPALAADPENVHACLAAGRIAAARRDLPAAEQYYEKVLAVRPNHEALVALGDLEAVAGRKEEAEEYYRKVEVLHRRRGARDVDDDLLLAKFYADHDRNLGEALRLIEPRLLTRNVLEADTVAWVLFKNGDLTHAREVMRRALRQRTPLAEFHYHAGMMAAATDDRSTAQRELGQALSLNPKFDPLQAPIAVQKLRQIGGRAPTSSSSPRSFAAPSSPPD